MLISSDWTFGLWLVRSLDPVPSSVSVFSETPGIIKTTLIAGSTSKDNHHTCGTSCWAKSSGVVNSYWRWLFTTIKFDPGERCFLDTQAPDIVNRFLAGVSTKDKEVWFTEDNTVSISSSWSTSHNRNDHPLRCFFAISHVKKIKIIRCETASAGGSSIYDHLHLLDVRRRMRSSRWRWHTLRT